MDDEFITRFFSEYSSNTCSTSDLGEPNIQVFNLGDIHTFTCHRKCT